MRRLRNADTNSHDSERNRGIRMTYQPRRPLLSNPGTPKGGCRGVPHPTKSIDLKAHIRYIAAVGCADNWSDNELILVILFMLASEDDRQNCWRL